MPDIATAGDKALTSWDQLNSVIIKADEATCRRLLAVEQKHLKRRQFVLRIHSRLNRIRASRERKELVGKR